jgi:valyl-tRNA synthetase
MKKIITTLLPLAVIASTSTAFAAPRITTTIDIKPESTLTAQEKESVSVAACRLLIHVDQARQLLKSKDFAGAKEQIQKAIDLAEIIKSVMPDYSVKTEVKTGTREYTDESKIKPLIVTIADEISEVAVLEPVKAAKRTGTTKTTSSRSVEDVIFGESSARLNVALTLPALTQAKDALAENKPEVTDKFLSDVQTDVDFESVVVDTQLVRAQKNLFMAKQAVRKNKIEEAKKYLRTAATSLEEYAKNAGADISKEATELREQISALTTNLETNLTGAEETINKLSQKVQRIE